MQIGHQRFVDHALAQRSIVHGPGHLDAAEHIAAHPIGTAEVKHFIVITLAPAEIQHPRMFKVAADDGAHTDLVLQARGQHAGTAHDEIDSGAGLAGLNQGLDECGVGQGIHLDHDARRLAHPRRSGHLLQMAQHAPVQQEGRSHQVLWRFDARLAGQLLENRIGICRETGIGGEVADIGIQPGAAGVVVAGGQMQIAVQSRFVAGTLAPRHQQQLGMRLQTHDAVDHLRAHRFQAFGPVDIGFFVKARFELDHHHHLFAAPRGFNQQIHQHRFGARAVDGLLDRQHIGVEHRITQELHHRLETFERVVQQHITLAQLLEHRARRLQARVGPSWLEGREAKCWRVGLVDELVQAHQVHGAVDLVQSRLGQGKLLHQKAHQIGRASAHHFQPDGLAEVARGQARAQSLAQVGDVVFVDIQLRIAGDAELRERLYGAARKQLTQMRADDAGEQHKTLPRSAHCIGQADHARQHSRHLDDGDLVFAAEGVTPTQPGDEIERLVGHQRKRVRRVQAHGHQQRAHVVLKKVLHPSALLRIALGVVDDLDAFALQRRHHFIVEHLVLLVDEFVGCGHHMGDVLR